MQFCQHLCMEYCDLMKGKTKMHYWQAAGTWLMFFFFFFLFGCFFVFFFQVGVFVEMPYTTFIKLS